MEYTKFPESTYRSKSREVGLKDFPLRKFEKIPKKFSGRKVEERKGLKN